jgi:hypothetical protein
MLTYLEAQLRRRFTRSSVVSPASRRHRTWDPHRSRLGLRRGQRNHLSRPEGEGVIAKTSNEPHAPRTRSESRKVVRRSNTIFRRADRRRRRISPRSEPLGQITTVLEYLTQQEPLRLCFCGVQAVFPIASAGPCQAFGCAWPRACASMHPTTAVAHCRRQTLLCSPRLGSASRGSIRIPRGIVIFQPARFLPLTMISAHRHHRRSSNRPEYCSGSLVQRWLAHLGKHEHVRPSFSAHLCPGNGLVLLFGWQKCA